MNLKTHLFIAARLDSHNKRFLLFQARDETNLKNESHHEKQRAKNGNQKPKRLAQNKTHKMKNFACLASKTRLPKGDGLQNEPAQKPAQDTYINFGKTAFTKKPWQAMNLAKRLIAAQNLILRSNKTHH